MKLFILSAVAICLTVNVIAAQLDSSFILIEAENPKTADFEFKTSNREGISSGDVLNFILQKRQIDNIPKNGLNLNYEVDVNKGGEFDLWFRVEFDYVRAPLEWRIDNGDWKEISGTNYTANLMQLSKWNTLSWAYAGKINLAVGKHSLDIKYSKLGSDGRFLVGLDCIALVKNKWTPEGKFKPGENYSDPKTKAAAKKVYYFPKTQNLKSDRTDLLLTGLWEVARFDDPNMDIDTYLAIKEIPKDEEYNLRWRGVDAPGDIFKQRPDMELAHRFFYRTKVFIPEDFKNKGFYLHFHGSTFIVSAFVNGKFCGSRRSLLVPGDIDISNALIPGKENTIVLGVKSPWYAMSPGSRPVFQYGEEYVNKRMKGNKNKIVYSIEKKRANPGGKSASWAAPVSPSGKGEGNAQQVGLVNPVRLVVVGKAYTEDIFIRTSLTNKSLDYDITIKNTKDKPVKVTIKNEAIYEKTGKVEKVFPVITAEVAAYSNKTIKATNSWENPKLWWPAESIDDKPDCYLMKTTVCIDGKPIDVKTERFGFREITYDGRHFLLNGIRWHFWNCHQNNAGGNDEEWLKLYFKRNNRFHRCGEGDNTHWDYREKSLEFFDKNGIPGRLSTCIDGMMLSLDLSRAEFWENSKEHVEQVVRAYRNHPSIMMWSLGNEMMLVTAKIAYSKVYGDIEKKAAELTDLQKKIDPTRRSFQDGGGSLGGLIDMNCQHYAIVKGDGFPSGAYKYLTCEEPFQPRENSTSSKRYRWNGNVPLILGEVCYYGGNNDKATWIGGPKTFRGPREADTAYGKFIRIASEGARFQDATAMCPWASGLPGGMEIGWERRAVFVREYTSLFFPKEKIDRTVRIFNDGRDSDPLTLKWKFVFDGKVTDSGEKTYNVKPGHWEEDSIHSTLIDTSNRVDGFLELELFAKDKLVFADKKPISIIPETKKIDGLSKNNLSVFDPEGNVKKWLKSKDQLFTEITDLAKIPKSAKILIIGKNALPQNIAAKKTHNKRKKQKNILPERNDAKFIAEFVNAGNTAIVLEQKLPLQGKELPVPKITTNAKQAKYHNMIWEEFDVDTGFSGSISFPMAPIHPIFNNLEEEDFFTWRGKDDYNFRNAYATPQSGVLSLVQAGDMLDLSALMEVPSGKGRYLLSQLLIAGKLGVEPAADQLLYNSLVWAKNKSDSKPVEIIAVCDDSLNDFLTETGAEFKRENNIETALKSNADVLIIQANVKAMDFLASNENDLKSFCDNGGWIMLSGLNKKGLADFNKIVGINHRLRNYKTERAVLENLNDPLLLGISDREIKQNAADMVAAYAKTYRVSSNVFSAVVDGVDITSFANFKDKTHARVANGLTNDDDWKYILYMKTKDSDFADDMPDRISFKYDHPETFSAIKIWPNPSYKFIKDAELIFDGDDDNSEKISLEPYKGFQEFKFNPRKAKEVVLKINSTQPNPLAQRDINITGIDLVQLIREIPGDIGEKVVFLSNPVGLAKYPIGKGGILLNQIDYHNDDGVGFIGRKKKKINQGNKRKKLTVFTNMLRNLGDN